MDSSFLQFLWIVWPFLAGWLFVLLHFWAKEIVCRKPQLTLKTFITDFVFTVPTVLVFRLIITVVALGFFSYPAFRDYSTLFPKHLDMEVFFDTEGIEQSLKQFSKAELSPFHITGNWKDAKGKYFERLESKLRNAPLGISAPSEFKFKNPNFHVYSKGSTSFVVRAVDGFQRYRITEAKGLVENVCEAAGKPSYTFSSEFELLDSAENWISLDFENIYLPSGWTYILTPRFKQIFRNMKGERCWDHTLVAITKVRYFPVPGIGRTIYLYEPSNQDVFIPVGYAVYSER
jgi:hypothetical protein